MSVRTPAVDPSTVGLKTMGTAMLEWASIWIGKGRLPYEKPLPEMDLEEMVRVWVPTLVSWME